MSDKIILSYDPGFGTTSLAAGVDRVSSIETAVARLNGSLGSAAVGMKTKAKATVIETEADQFYVGVGAWNWGEANLISMDYSSLTSPARLALLYASFSKLFQPGNYDIDTFAIGLPVPLLRDATQTAEVLKQLREIREKDHSFKVGKKQYKFKISRRMIYFPQPAGSYTNWLVGSDLKVINGRQNKEVAVIDIGRNTVDIYVIEAGQVNPRYIGGEKYGTRFLIEQLASQNPGRDSAELDSMLRHGKIAINETIRRDWFSLIMGTIEATLGDMRRFGLVRVTGGGSIPLKTDFQIAIYSRGAVPDFPDNPVEDVVIGGWKWAARLK